jgi:anhydro-N-acetylmuramic acid kinase
VLLNIGGIANITWLKAGGTIEDVIAFDTGPGNCISDHLCRMQNPDGPGYDVDGQIASRGKADTGFAMFFARNEYVFQRPPKSTDGPAMLALFEETKRAVRFEGSFEDEVATANGCCAQAIKLSVDLGHQSFWKDSVQEILVSGGGTGNPILMTLLRECFGGEHCLTPATIRVLDATTARAKEALSFALLGAATLDSFPSNVPSATGAKRSVVLGSITPKP